MRTALLTSVYQVEVKIIERDKIKDPEELKSYDYNLPPGGTDKWDLIEYPDKRRAWHPKHSYTFNTPLINDHGKVTLTVKE